MNDLSDKTHCHMAQVYHCVTRTMWLGIINDDG
jgi:hypothetical protein